MDIGISDFIIYQKKVEQFLESPNSSDVEELIEEIHSAAFMNKISSDEENYLIDLLPVSDANGLDDEDDEDDEDFNSNSGFLGLFG